MNTIEPVTLRITLFGGLTIKVDPEQPLKFVSIRAELFVAWLVMNPGQHRRERLADLLWDERDSSRALGNMRTLLARLPKPIKSFLQTSTQSIGLDPEARVIIDLLEFDRLMVDEHLSTSKEIATKAIAPKAMATKAMTAEEMATGEILAGIFVEESEGLDEWMVRLREAYQQKSIDLLHKLTELSLTQRDFSQGVLYAQKLVQLDPLRESSYRTLMLLLARSGRRVEALKVFTRCTEMLQDEFDLTPEAETNALAQRLRGSQSARHNLPSQPTPFIGRSKEVSLLRDLLLVQDQRLVTIVGAGGMGKTRLSLACGDLLANDFLDGVAFVQLAAIERADLVGATIGTTLTDAGFIPAIPPNQPIDRYLWEQLHNKELLLILDNFDRLLDAAPLLAELLNQTVAPKILVTSRSRLGLRGEHLVNLGGLDYSSDVGNDEWETADAVQLFLQTTQQLSPTSELTTAERAALTEICRIVDGMPLALELAARTTRLYSYQGILAKISQNIDYLASNDRDMPARHRSIQAAFEYSWQQLTESEQRSLARMSIFRGQFELAAAEYVNQTTSDLLASLLDHSLVNRGNNRDEDGPATFSLHPLLREFARQKLSQLSNDLTFAEQHHCQYYLGHICTTNSEQESSEIETTQRVRANIDNIRLAWETAIRYKMWPLLVEASQPLFIFWDRSGLNQEGTASLESLLSILGDTLSTEHLLEISIKRVRLLRNMAGYEDAIAEMTDAEKRLDADANLDERAAAELYLIWGEILIFQSKLDAAAEKIHQSMALAANVDADHHTAEGFRLLGLVSYDMGNLTIAIEHFQKAHHLFQKIADWRGLAYTQNNFGMVYSLLGDHPTALDWHIDAIASWERIGDVQSVLTGKTNIGYVSIMMGRFSEGLPYLEEASRGFSEAGHIIGEGHALKNQGIAYTRLGRYPLAERLLTNALHLFRKVGNQNHEILAHFFLVALYRNWGRAKQAYGHIADASAIATELANQEMHLMAHTYLGYLALDDGDGTKAQREFEDALQLQSELDRAQPTHENRAGLAAALQLLGQQQEAETLLRADIETLTPATLWAAWQPLSVVDAYIQVLQDSEADLAKQISQMRLDMLAEWERNAPDEASRESLRTAVPAHRALLAYQEQIR